METHFSDINQKESFKYQKQQLQFRFDIAN